VEEGLYESLLTERLSRALAARPDLRADIDAVYEGDVIHNRCVVSLTRSSACWSTESWLTTWTDMCHRTHFQSFGHGTCLAETASGTVRLVSTAQQGSSGRRFCPYRFSLYLPNMRPTRELAAVTCVSFDTTQYAPPHRHPCHVCLAASLAT
jgi:hypothetical protein